MAVFGPIHRTYRPFEREEDQTSSRLGLRMSLENRLRLSSISACRFRHIRWPDLQLFRSTQEDHGDLLAPGWRYSRIEAEMTTQHRLYLSSVVIVILLPIGVAGGTWLASVATETTETNEDIKKICAFLVGASILMYCILSLATRKPPNNSQGSRSLAILQGLGLSLMTAAVSYPGSWYTLSMLVLIAWVLLFFLCEWLSPETDWCQGLALNGSQEVEGLVDPTSSLVLDEMA